MFRQSCCFFWQVSWDNVHKQGFEYPLARMDAIHPDHLSNPVFDDLCVFFKKSAGEPDMNSLQDDIAEYHKQLDRGMLQRAYRGLMEYILGLKGYFQNKYPHTLALGGVYQGYMDMTYFPIVTPSLKQKGLKIAIVFLHEACRFEAWLSATNKSVQLHYWNLFREKDWNQYPQVPTLKGADAVIELILVEKPDFGDADELTQEIDIKTMKFIQNLESFFSTWDC